MQNGKSSEAVHQYKKVEFNPGVIPPDAPEGEWELTALRGRTTVKPIQSGASAGYPMVTFRLRIDRAADESANDSNETFLGVELPLRITMVSDRDGAIPGWMKRRVKLQLRALADACDFDLDIIPTTVSSPDDLTPFIQAVEGSTFTGYTTHRKDTRGSGETMVDISLTKPGAFSTASAGATSSTTEDE